MDKQIHAIWRTPAGAYKHRFVNSMGELPQEYRDSPWQQAALRYPVTRKAITLALLNDKARTVIMDNVNEPSQPGWEDNVRRWFSTDILRKTVK